MSNSVTPTRPPLTPSGPERPHAPLRESLQAVLERIQVNPPQSGQYSGHSLPTTCPECSGTGWLAVVGKSGFQRVVDGKPEIRRCACKSGADERAMAARLQAIDGLTPAERQIDFCWFTVTASNRDGYAAVVAAVQDMRRPRGFVFLSGPPGIGKTMLSMCAVNDARNRGYASVYVTAKNLLDHLRAAFAPDSAVTYDARWELITGASVLAIDELSLTAAKPWAVEQLEELIGIRYRRIDECLTIVATNHRASEFTPKLVSRFGDQRVQRPDLGSVDFRRWRQP